MNHHDGVVQSWLSGLQAVLVIEGGIVDPIQLVEECVQNYKPNVSLSIFKNCGWSRVIGRSVKKNVIFNLGKQAILWQLDVNESVSKHLIVCFQSTKYGINLKEDFMALLGKKKLATTETLP